MSGNVFEWCFDSGSWRVVRGGGWNITALYLRVGSVADSNPDYEYNYLGFRVSRTAE